MCEIWEAEASWIFCKSNILLFPFTRSSDVFKESQQLFVTCFDIYRLKMQETHLSSQEKAMLEVLRKENKVWKAFECFWKRQVVKFVNSRKFSNIHQIIANIVSNLPTLNFAKSWSFKFSNNLCADSVFLQCLFQNISSQLSKLLKWKIAQVG